MIDRFARGIGASALKKFLEGAITNEEYEEMYPKSENDPALSEISLQVWFLYSDNDRHKLAGKHSLDDEQSEFMERCILFLKSDLEFEWPLQKFRPLHGIFRRIGFVRETDESRIGNETVWPFYTIEQYDENMRKNGSQ